MKCYQEPECTEAPAFRYTWPGQEEHYACLRHKIELANVAAAMGFQLQFLPINSQPLGVEEKPNGAG